MPTGGLLTNFALISEEIELTELPSEKVLQFFNIVTEGCKPQTKRVRFTHLSSFFNFLKNNLDLNFENPCDLPMLRKLFRPTVIVRWNIIEKETVDEIIFRTTNVRNRLILELMARGGMRIGEVLKLRSVRHSGSQIDHQRSKERKRAGGCIYSSKSGRPAAGIREAKL